MSNVKLVSFVPKGIEGVNRVAYGLLSNALLTATAAHGRSNTWKETIGLVCGAVGEQEGTDAVTAAGDVFVAIKAAIGSAVIARALSEAGYGAFDQITTDEDGRELIPAKAANVIHTRYGDKFKLDRIVKKAQTTIEQYRANVISAYEAGATLTPDMTVRSVVEATASAKIQAMSPEELRIHNDAKERNDTAREVSTQFAAAYKTGDAGQQTALGMVSAIMDSWKHADPVLTDAFLEAMAPWCDKFREAAVAANPVGEEGADAAIKALEESLADDGVIERVAANG